MDGTCLKERLHLYPKILSLKVKDKVRSSSIVAEDLREFAPHARHSGVTMTLWGEASEIGKNTPRRDSD